MSNKIEIKCNGKTIEDCYDCDRYFSSFSLHLCRIRKIKISEINCSIGGDRVFNEKGELIP